MWLSVCKQFLFFILGVDDMRETAIFGGGCFWCTEGVFSALKGVLSVEPGYSGGHVMNPSYEQVCGKETGHIEVVKVVYDPNIVSYEQLLDVFFHTHDPTTADRQGADIGPQYASAVFCQDAEQREQVFQAIDTYQAEFEQPIVTHVLDNDVFWPAEIEHHNYYARNPQQGYCQMVVGPKIHAFKQRYQSWLQ